MLKKIFSVIILLTSLGAALVDAVPLITAEIGRTQYTPGDKLTVYVKILAISGFPPENIG